MNLATLQLSRAELIEHQGLVFAVWSEQWESSHPEDAYEQARFAFSEAVAREEFLRLKASIGTDPDLIRESLALFRVSLDPDEIRALPDDDGQIDASYLHPVAVFRRDSVVSKRVRSEVLETAGGALGALWSQLTADLPRQPRRDGASAAQESEADRKPKPPPATESLEVLLDHLAEAVQSMPECAGTLPGETIDPSIGRIEHLRASILEVLEQNPPFPAWEALSRCAALPDVSYQIQYYHPPTGIAGGNEITISFEPVRTKAQSLTDLRGALPASPVDRAQEIGAIIEEWADLHGLPLQGQAGSANRVVLLVLNGEKIPGEMTIVGQIAIVTVRERPAAYAIETTDGGWIVDESWADASSLASILNSALRMLRQRVKAPLAQWAAAYAVAAD